MAVSDLDFLAKTGASGPVLDFLAKTGGRSVLDFSGFPAVNLVSRGCLSSTENRQRPLHRTKKKKRHKSPNLVAFYRYPGC